MGLGGGGCAFAGSSSVLFCAAAAAGFSLSAASADGITALSSCKRRSVFDVLWLCENGEDGKLGKKVCEKVAERAMRGDGFGAGFGISLLW